MKTIEDTREFVGGGKHGDLSDSDRDRYAQEIADAANSHARWSETRSMTDLLVTVPTTVTDSDGNETHSDSRMLDPGENPTSIPEGFGGVADATE